MNDMKCKKCKNEIPDGSIFCNWCGARQIRERKAKAEISVPAPRQLKSGKWNIELRAEGQSITEDTAEKCKAKAQAIRAGFIEAKKAAPKKTLETAMQEYIDEHKAVLSPSTIYGYDDIKRNRFKAYSQTDIFSAPNWQLMINAEASLCSAKTLKNAWGFVARILRYNGVSFPEVTLPQVVKKELAWLSYEQILTFLDAIKGTEVEFAALLALHSLRRSELLAISPSKISKDGIHVSGAIVPAVGNVFVSKETNKNDSSARVVPVMIPRLQELIDSSTNAPDEPYVKICPNNIYTHLQKVCNRAGLPVIGVHGLRRSFASLAYHLGWSERKTMLIGGWSDFKTMHGMYIKLDSTDIKEAAESMHKFYTDNITKSDDFTNEITNAS